MSIINCGQISPTVGVQLPNFTTGTRPSNPATGLIIYNTTTEYMELYNGVEWINVGGGPQADGSTPAKAATSVQEILDAGKTADDFYYFNFGNGVERLYAPLSTDPGYVCIASWNGGLSSFFGAAVTGNQLNPDGAETPIGSLSLNSTYGYHRNTGTEGDYKWATISHRNIVWRYAKFRFHLYNYYSNDGFTANRNLSNLGISGNCGDGLTILRNNPSDGNGQHIFTYLHSINQGGYYCSNGGTSPTMSTGGVAVPSHIGSRFCCIHRTAGGYAAEYVRNFTPLAGDNSGGSTPSVYPGDAWYTVDTGSSRNHGLHVAIHSDQATANEDTYMKRGVLMVKA